MGGPKTPGNFVQDGPPKGGYPTVNVKRNLPGGGMSTLAMGAAMSAAFVYGMYTVIQANRFRRCVLASRVGTADSVARSRLISCTTLCRRNARRAIDRSSV